MTVIFGLLNCSVAVQGMGAGGLISIPPMILADIVPLKERGLYQGLVSL